MSTVVFEKEIQGLPEKFVDLDEFLAWIYQRPFLYELADGEISEDIRASYDESFSRPLRSVVQ